MPRAARLRRTVTTLVAALVVSAGTVTASDAAVTLPPQLRTLVVSTTQVTPPGTVELRYEASAEVATLGYINALYTSPVGVRGNVVLRVDQAPLAGTLSWSIPDGLRNGTYTLSSVTVMSSDGTAATRYERDGTTSRGGTHGFDLPGKDVTVSGGNEDLTGPTLTGVSVPTTTVRPGQPVTVGWTVDEPHGLASASFVFRGSRSAMELSSSSAGELATGRLTRTLWEAVYNEPHLLSQVILSDSLGNRTVYYADGRRTNLPYDSTLQTATHELDLASARFTVTGSAYDADPPRLTSIALNRRTGRAGDPVTVTYATQDDTAPLEQVVLRYSRPGGAETVSDLGASNLPLSGSFTGHLRYDVLGDLALQSVEVMDRKGNLARYLRDGTVTSGGSTSTSRHTLDLTALDLRVTPSAVSFVARSRPQSAELAWSLPDGQGAQVTGYRITVSPGGKVVDLAGTGKDYQRYVVTGLVNATTYTITLTPQSKVGPGPTTRQSVTPLISGNVWSAGDINLDGRNDLFAQLPSGLDRLYRGKGGATFGPGTTVADYPGYRPFPGDRASGLAAFYVVSTWDNRLEGVDVDRDGKSWGGVDIGSGWGMRFLDGSADFTSDGRADLVGVTPGGNAYLYRATTTGGAFTKGTQIASGWGSMQRVFAASDVTGDRRADLLGVDSAGVLWIFPGNGAGRFHTKRKVGSGWGGLGGLFYARDVSGDGRGDLGAVTMGGTLRVYKGRGNGTFTGAVSVSSGWAPYL